MKDLSKTRIEIFLLFIVYIVVLPRMSMEYDMGFWKDWALYIHQLGLGNAYNFTSINYFPVYLYALSIYDWLHITDASIAANIYQIKLLFIFFDFLPIIVLCCFKKKILNFDIPYLYLLLNIAYLFNSMVWGQLDSMYVNLAFLAIVLGFQYPIICLLLYTLALNTKPQAIEFLPILFFVLWYSIRQIKTLIIALISAICLQILLITPFILCGSLNKLIYHAFHAVDLYSNLSISAFNIWYLITKGNPYLINDNSTYFIFSFKTIGFTLFTLSACFLIFFLAKHFWHLRKKQMFPIINTYQLVFLTTGLLCLCFFYFNTQMHERYAHPILIFFFFYGVVSKNYRLYLLASIPYYLSLDKCFSYPNGFLPIEHFKIIYASQIIAIWYTATLIYGAYLFLRLQQKHIA